MSAYSARHQQLPCRAMCHRNVLLTCWSLAASSMQRSQPIGA
jgi:hypothetical protein